MRYESESGDILMALTGESLISRRLSPFREEGFLKLIEILRNADATFTNAECLFQNYQDYPNTFAGGGSGIGTYMASPPQCISELQWAGIDIVSTANNHGSDFGEGGVLTNLKYLDDAGMPHAGSGPNLTTARAPAYLDTAKGRVALIAAADWGPRGVGGHPWPFPMGVMAGEQSPYSKGRPGCNLIRHRMSFTVDKPVFDALRRMSKELGFDKELAGRAARGEAPFGEDTETELTFMDCRIVLGESFSARTVANSHDLEANYKWIRDARRMADWVMVSFHNHGASNSPEEPSEHTKVFARGCIDNGADVFIGHGPHRDRGIEIYKGKPIFYSLGDFILQNQTVLWAPYEVMDRMGLGHEHTPADFYDVRDSAGFSGSIANWESVVATVSYQARKLKEIRLYPVDLGMGLPRSQSGRPILAEPGSEISDRVLKRFQSMSQPFGTSIHIENGVGIIRVGK